MFQNILEIAIQVNISREEEIKKGLHFLESLNFPVRMLNNDTIDLTFKRPDTFTLEALDKVHQLIVKSLNSIGLPFREYEPYSHRERCFFVTVPCGWIPPQNIPTLIASKTPDELLREVGLNVPLVLSAS